MKHVIYGALVFGLILFGGIPVGAQEDIETSSEELVVEEELDTPQEEEVLVESDEADNGVDSEETLLSDEEIEILLEEAELLSGDDLEELDGEILAITEDELIIATEEGEIVVVAESSFQQILSTGTRKKQAGDKIKSGVVTRSEEGLSVTTQSGPYTISPDVRVSRNGKEASLDAIEEGDTVVIILDAHDDVLALDVTGEDHQSFPFAFFAIILIVLIALILRRKRA